MITVSNATHKPDSRLYDMAAKGWRSLMERTDVGFLRLPAVEEPWRQCDEVGRKLNQAFKTLAIVGMGGSTLGAQALREALLQRPRSDRLVFFDNVDEYAFSQKLSLLSDLKSVHWLLISKSGNTVETLLLAQRIEQELNRQGLKLAKASTVISELRSNPLTDWARQNHVEILAIPEDVGGRYSVLTPVGLLPAAFADLNLKELRDGAGWALTQADLVGELVAQSLASFERQEWITLFWTYSERLKTFGAWWQQLWAESLAKKETVHKTPAPRVSSPFVCQGSNDQHSILQQVMEGARDKFIWFVRESSAEALEPKIELRLFKGFEFLQGKSLGELQRAQAQATQQALADQGVSSLCFRVNSLNEKSMGALLMTMQLVVAALAECLSINAFDQPGVEAGKKLARRIISN